MKVISKIAWVLVIVGALNWGLQGLGGLVSGSDWGVVSALLGTWPAVENVVYLLVGISGIVSLWGCSSCKKCDAGAPMA